MRSPRRFAAPIVVTAAALTGCASGQTHDNPPPPAHEPVLNPPHPQEPAQPPPRPQEPHVNPPPPHLVEPPPALPIASDPSHVTKNADGTCTEFHNVKCPPDVRCNPPPPRQVQCPPGK